MKWAFCRSLLRLALWGGLVTLLLAKASWYFGSSASVNQSQQTSISGNKVEVYWDKRNEPPGCPAWAPHSYPHSYSCSSLIPHALRKRNNSCGSRRATSGHQETWCLLRSPLQPHQLSPKAKDKASQAPWQQKPSCNTECIALSAETLNEGNYSE